MRIPVRRRRAAHALIAASVATLSITGDAFAQMLTLAFPPLAGFQPLVVFGLTSEQAGADSIDFASHASSTPNGNNVPGQTLPIGQPQKFFVGILDTGAQASLISASTALQADLAGADREGTLSQTVVGASGQEFPLVSDTLGLYFTSLGNASNNGGDLSVAPGTLSGMWNTSVLRAENTSELPNLIGAPVIGLYQVKIANSQPVHVEVDGVIRRSPHVSFADRNTPVSSDYGRVGLQVTNTVGGAPSFVPDINAIFDPDWDGNFGNNPAVPTIWESLFVNVDLSHTGGSKNDETFFFDTGAEVTVLSSLTAADLGIFTTGENATPADFTIEVAGVGGTTTEVPGYYLNQLSLTTTSQNINYVNTPVIVLDVPDPRNPNQVVPGILGTNLFASYDLIINVGQGNSFLYLSPQWAWKGTAGGNWNDPSKWGLVIPDGIDTQANFFTPAGATGPQSVTVNSPGFTVGSIAFDNLHSYTVEGPGRITLDVSTSNAQINVNRGNHTINAPMTLLDDTDVDTRGASSSLLITSDVIATGVAINKFGAGTVSLKNLRAESLNLNRGTVKITENGTNTGASRITELAFSGTQTLDAKLDLTNNALAIDYEDVSPAGDIRGWLLSGFDGGTWTGEGIVSSLAAAVAADPSSSHKTGIGYAEASAIGNPGIWFGQDITGDAILMRYTLLGDVNLDGTVDSADFSWLAANFNAVGAYWWEGDFNYDGTVNALDFNVLATNFGAPLPASVAALVPEPASLIPAALALGLLRRKRAL